MGVADSDAAGDCCAGGVYGILAGGVEGDIVRESWALKCVE